MAFALARLSSLVVFAGSAQLLSVTLLVLSLLLRGSVCGGGLGSVDEVKS
jgi:hypothetical protein